MSNPLNPKASDNIAKPEYHVNSDGSPEMIEYRNKVNTGEIVKRGRPFKTAEERAAAKRKRKEYQQSYYAKRKALRRKKLHLLPYNEAKSRIRGEGIRSAREYFQWYKIHRPAVLPQSPRDFYTRRGEWSGWGDFLGVVNAFPYINKGKWRPYKEARAYAHSKGFRTVPEWIEYCKNGNCPADIPHRPDVAYFKTGEWFSWREFLGPQCQIALRKSMETINDRVLYILHVPDNSDHKLYKIGVTVGGRSAIRDAVAKFRLRFIDAFIIEDDFDWKGFISQYGSPAWDGDGVFHIDNVYELTLGLGQYYQTYSMTDGS